MGAKRNRKATPKQRRFAQHYAVHLNATRAAIEAGYAKGRASEQGYQLLQKPPVQEAIAEFTKDREERVRIDADMVLTHLYEIARLDLAECFDEHDNLLPIKAMPEHVRRALSGMDIDRIRMDGDLQCSTAKLKLPSKVEALKLLGQHLRLFVERVEHSGEVALAERIRAGRRRTGRE